MLTSCFANSMRTTCCHRFALNATPGVVAGWLLGLDDTRVIDLSAMLRNTALTEVRWSARRRSLVSFNALPHLPDQKSATAV